MKKKISLDDFKIWKKFISSNELIEDKDVTLDESEKKFFKIRKIDMHGYTLDDANKKIKDLLIKYYKEKVHKVIVITGKGLRSKNENNPYISKDLSLLKNSIPEFLSRDESLKEIIKSTSKADIEDGEEGAFYVYLKKFKE